MRKLYSSQDIILIRLIKAELEAHGIACVMRYANLEGAAAGEVPPIVCWPEIRVGEEDEVPAKRVLEGILADLNRDRPQWRCPGCGERLEGQFSHCWQCGGERPPDASLA